MAVGDDVVTVFTNYVAAKSVGNPAGVLAAQLVADFKKLHSELRFPPPGLTTKRFVELQCRRLQWLDPVGSASRIAAATGSSAAITRAGVTLPLGNVNGSTKEPEPAKAKEAPKPMEAANPKQAADGPTPKAGQSSGSAWDNKTLVESILSNIEIKHTITSPTDLDALIDALPWQIALLLKSGPPEQLEGLAELVFDLGREPHLLYKSPDREGLHKAHFEHPEVDEETIDEILQKLSDFGSDNRAGIPGTLHRISRKLNRTGKVIGLTVRCGRSLGNSHRLLRAELDKGLSILFVGKPGSGKTTLIRDCAAYLARTRRVEIVDTSCELAGSGDVPHAAVGECRRMMVPTRSVQHSIMTEAVQNHTPEVLVIDEIGSAAEVSAARDVAQRGVQLIASAHGTKIGDILSSPVLMKLLGDVHTVILAASEAKTRFGDAPSSKTVNERMGVPAFDVVVEIDKTGSIVVVSDVPGAVDAGLGGKHVGVEVRSLKDDGSVEVVEAEMDPRAKKH